MKITVLGAGAWGTALAKVLCENGHDVTLWGHQPDHINSLASTRRNESYLPGITLPESLQFDTQIANAITGRDMLVFAVPSKAIREVADQCGPHPGVLVSVTRN